MIHDPVEMRNQWASYFEKLFTPKENTQFDDNWKQKIEAEVEDLQSKHLVDKSNVERIASTDIAKQLAKMKNKKAPGYDGLTAEHLKYAGKTANLIISTLFNGIMYHELIPQQFKKGILIPIPKEDKDKSKQDNYRGITLLPSVRKLFEKVVLSKLSCWIREDKIIDNLQGAAQEKCSSLQTSLLVLETIARYQEQETSLYVCMFDVKKAYDGVGQKGLFYKIYHTGMHNKTWRLIKEMFSGFKCCVELGGDKSSWFAAQQGIVQGGPLSLIGYEMFNKDLLVQLKNHKAGTAIGARTTTCPAFADDVTIMAPTKQGLQELLNIAYTYSSKWRYEYNASKCSIVVFGVDQCPSIQLRLGPSIVPVKSGEIHVGIMLSPCRMQNSKYIKERIEKCKLRSRAMMGIGSINAPLTPKAADKLYWTVCVPKLLYGLHLMDIKHDSYNQLESYHAETAKMIQGLPEQSSNDGAIFTMGWPSIRGYMDSVKLIYFMQILLLPVTSMYKLTLIQRFCDHVLNDNQEHYGPCWEFIKACRKYKWCNIVEKYLVGEATLQIKEWKQRSTDIMWKREQTRWAIISSMSKTLVISYSI